MSVATPDSGELPHPVGTDLLRQAYREHVIAKRVELGIRYLSNAYGGVTGLDWLSKVVGPVEMGNNAACVLGYVTGDFATSPLVTTLGFDYARKWGFYLDTDDLYAGLTYDELTAEWQKRIARLKRERADKLLALAKAGLDDSWQEDA